MKNDNSIKELLFKMSNREKLNLLLLLREHNQTGYIDSMIQESEKRRIA